MTFLSTVAFKATKILRTLRADILLAVKPAEYLKEAILPANYQSL